MASLAHSVIAYTSNSSATWLDTYTNFIKKADYNRIGWAATAIALQGCILSPAMLLAMDAFGGGDWQFLVSMMAFLLVLVPILSAMSVRYLFPAFAISTVVHLAIILMDIL